VSAVSPTAPSSHAAALYERHGGRVLRFCQSRLGSREDAEDATQTTFLNAVGALRRGTVPRSEAAWLLRIAENVCHHRHRTAARRRESACDPTVLADAVEAAPGPPDELIHLEAALESLPERQRLAVLLREWQGLSYDEIGTELGLSHSAVETLLFRARRGLAQALEHDGRRRRGLGLAPLLAWLKTAVGAGTAVKIASAVVVAGVVVTPMRDAPAPRPTPPPVAPVRIAPVAPAAAVTAATPVPTVQQRKPVAGQRSRPAASDRPQARSSRGAGVPVADADPPSSAAPGPTSRAPEQQQPAPPAPDPPAQQPKQDAPAPSIPAPRVEPPVQLPVPVPVPVPSVPEIVDTLPGVPQLPQAPDLPLPDLPLPSLP
jgi:RNA polymerase sigma factor (sigma-70 family)